MNSVLLSPSLYTIHTLSDFEFSSKLFFLSYSAINADNPYIELNKLLILSDLFLCSEFSKITNTEQFEKLMIHAQNIHVFLMQKFNSFFSSSLINFRFRTEKVPLVCVRYSWYFINQWLIRSYDSFLVILHLFFFFAQFKSRFFDVFIFPFEKFAFF